MKLIRNINLRRHCRTNLCECRIKWRNVTIRLQPTSIFYTFVYSHYTLRISFTHSSLIHSNKCIDIIYFAEISNVYLAFEESVQVFVGWGDKFLHKHGLSWQRHYFRLWMNFCFLLFTISQIITCQYNLDQWVEIIGHKRELVIMFD